MNNSPKMDFLIIGAGIIGLSIARSLLKKYPDKKITIIDKIKYKSGVQFEKWAKQLKKY